MSEADLQGQIEAARAYESLFVPALFGQWVHDVADAAAVQAGQSALDVACGTGILGAEVASRVGPAGRVVGLDPNPGMLAVARENAPAIDWRQGSAEDIPFPDAEFDAVLSQFGLMFFRDPDLSIREMLRILRPAGHLAIAVWDAIENIPAYTAELELIERLGGTAAAEAVRAPFALGDKAGLGALVERGGGASVGVTTHQGQARFPDVRTMVEAELRGWLPVMGVHLDETVISTILEEAEEALAAHVTLEGTVVFDVTAHIVTARKA
jgi:SAM-dependent methyltransferase